jgi:hypothetical protein
MSTFNFADRYAQAGLAPGAVIIEARQATVGRLVKTLTTPQMLDLVGLYYKHPSLDLAWLRDEFIKEDTAFSLVNNERECAILAATILGSKVSEGNPVAILALVTASLCDKYMPEEAGWLLDDAKQAHLNLAAAARRMPVIDTEITTPSLVKLSDDLKALPANDWNQLLGGLGKIQTEMRVIAAKTTTTAECLTSAMQYQREETQMLWWLFSEYSRALSRKFDSLSRGVAAVVAGLDLGELTTYSTFGPVAAPAMLERVLRLACVDKDQKSLNSILSTIDAADLEKMKVYGTGRPARIFPISTAIKLAKEAPEGWVVGLKRTTDIDAGIELEPLGLAIQTYNESLLGQLM